MSREKESKKILLDLSRAPDRRFLRIEFQIKDVISEIKDLEEEVDRNSELIATMGSADDFFGVTKKSVEASINNSTRKIAELLGKQEKLIQDLYSVVPSLLDLPEDMQMNIASFLPRLTNSIPSQERRISDINREIEFLKTSPYISNLNRNKKINELRELQSQVEIAEMINDIPLNPMQHEKLNESFRALSPRTLSEAKKIILPLLIGESPFPPGGEEAIGEEAIQREKETGEQKEGESRDGEDDEEDDEKEEDMEGRGESDDEKEEEAPDTRLQNLLRREMTVLANRARDLMIPHVQLGSQDMKLLDTQLDILQKHFEVLEAKHDVIPLLNLSEIELRKAFEPMSGAVKEIGVIREIVDMNNPTKKQLDEAESVVDKLLSIDNRTLPHVQGRKIPDFPKPFTRKSGKGATFSRVMQDPEALEEIAVEQQMRTRLIGRVGQQRTTVVNEIRANTTQFPKTAVVKRQLSAVSKLASMNLNRLSIDELATLDREMSRLRRILKI